MITENQTKTNGTAAELLEGFAAFLYKEEKSTNTIAKYVRDLRAFLTFLGGREITKSNLLEWKEQLTETHAPLSVNSMLAAVNSFLGWMGISHLSVKPLKIQHEIFSKPEKELTRGEYTRLVKTAKSRGNLRLSLLLQTICSTGIRVSELKFITVEAIGAGRAIVDCKGKNRTVFLAQDLCQLLRSYCRKQAIKSGPVFCTRYGNPLNRTNIWRDMKSLCRSANVAPKKVFPHNLRHLFARIYYSLEKDLSKLADLLGHSNLSTTRIYTMESGTEHIRQLERMRLVCTKNK